MELSKSFNLCSSKLYREFVLTEKSPTFVFSPFSILTTLTMVYFGTAGISKNQLLDFFRQLTPENNARVIMDSLQLSSHQEQMGVRLKGANCVFVDKNVDGLSNDVIFQAFKNMLKEKLNAESELVDFKYNSSEEREKINKWVEDVTNKKIKDLLGDSTVTQDTILVLVSAIYFKSSWMKVFKSEPLDEAWKISSNPKFVGLDENNQTNVQTGIKYMELKEVCSERFPFGYFESDKLGFNLKVIEIPYVGFRHSMVVFMPEKATDLPSLESRWYSNPETLDEIVTLMQNSKKEELSDVQVTLRFPSFKIHGHTVDIKQTLKSLGLNSLFDDEADLSAISSHKKLKVDGAYHQAVVDVDEKGTEAAAATAFAVSCMCMPFIRKSTTINVDSSFLFQIRSREGPEDGLRYTKPRSHDTILFTGRITDMKSLQK